MEASAVLTAQAQEVTVRALTIPEQAKELTIKSNDDYLRAGALWKTVTDLMKEVEDTFGPIIDRAHKAHKEALAQKAKYYQPLDESKRSIKRLMDGWEQEQDRLRREEERRLQEEARLREQERQLQEAVEAEQNGDTATAEAILEEVVEAPVIALPKTTPKIVGGPVSRTVWAFEVTDVNKIPREYLKIDEVKIGQIVRAMKRMTNIPGIRAFEKRV